MKNKKVIYTLTIMVIIVPLLLLSFIIIGRRTRNPIDMEYEAGKIPEKMVEANVVAKAYTYMKQVGEENAYQTVIDIWYGNEYMISKGASHTKKGTEMSLFICR